MGKKKTLEGAMAVVTGACSGIGLEFCHRLAERGAALLMISNRDSELRDAAADVARKYGVATTPLTVDLCSERACSDITDFIDANHLDPAILINNAGIFAFAPVCETSRAKTDCFIKLHVKAVTDLSREFARRFAARGGGRILNMSSMSCWTPMPGIALYSATKAYIRAFSRALHYEMRDAGVSVTVACPGGIATDLFGLPVKLRRLAVNIGVLQTPERFTAKAVKKMLAGHKQYINGWLNRFSIVLVGITPTPVRMLIKRKMLDKGIRR